MHTARREDRCAVEAREALREAHRAGVLEVICMPKCKGVGVCDWYFEPELPEFMFIPGSIPSARRVSRMKETWRDELPYICREPGQGLDNPLDCYFVDPATWECFVFVTSPWVAHDYELGTCPKLARKYPCAMFLKRRPDACPFDRDTIRVYMPPHILRTLKLVDERSFIEGVV